MTDDRECPCCSKPYKVMSGNHGVIPVQACRCNLDVLCGTCSKCKVHCGCGERKILKFPSSSPATRGGA